MDEVLYSLHISISMLGLIHAGIDAKNVVSIHQYQSVSIAINLNQSGSITIHHHQSVSISISVVISQKVITNVREDF